ncbi:uncharacterized protein BP5553_05558 [Venustampulla echinocandica]|uniref:Uncharacterized protein n=1 Tax=Venustampulla echinocandica TaxID=2656787 RepID=A0A370TRG7_9HELO|nr:uncharacterized protein BP5553_05558 [Venustampulla echinocandica]RDL38125.1 hypothetical protein BP5553_05558 [Venustampulla echinocandica]
MANTTSRKLKTIYQLDSPFTSTQWPEISPQNQDTILELLCSLLSPIGRWRANHITPSKGKRSKKRKRQEAKSENLASIDPTPPPPELASFAVVGLSDITRKLQACSQPSLPTPPMEGAPNKLTPHEPETSGQNVTPTDPEKLPEEVPAIAPTPVHFSIIFVLRPSQATILHDHLPQLVATASSVFPQLPATRLVQLPKGCDARLCEALRLPRVSFIGLQDNAPHSKSLVDFVRGCVPGVEVSWIREARKADYLPVKINAIETLAPVAKAKANKGS